MFTPARSISLVGPALIGSLALATGATAGTTTLTIDGDACQTSAQIVIDINLSDATDMIVGGQFFLEYNTAVLDFVAADAGNAPFTLEVFEQVNETNGTIDYAVGVPGGGPGTFADTTMFRLTFDSIASQCTAVADLVTFRTDGSETLLTDNIGTSVTPALVNIQPLTIDAELPVITCPPNVAVDCPEDLDPGLPFATVTGGVAIYYNDNGLGEVPTNQAYLRTQFSSTNLNGTALDFSSVPLDGGGFNWADLYQTVNDQYGLDFIMTAPTSDGSVVTPTLMAFDNIDDTVGGAAAAGDVEWAISHYTGGSEGPGDPANDVINSLLRGLAPGSNSVIVTRSDLTLAGPVFTVVLEGFLVSDGTNYWETLGMPDSPLADFGIDDIIYFSGTLMYDATGDDGSDLVDFYEGTLELTANFQSAEVGFATATDNCGEPVVTYSDVPDAGTGCAGDPQTITRTWQAVDACGNVATCDQIITLEDNVDPTYLFTPPNISTPAYAGFCTANLTAADIGVPIATDNCDLPPDITFVRDDGQSNIDDPYDPIDSPITITWTAEDACGNFVDHVQTVEVTDTNDMDVVVELAGVWDIADLPLTISRCITFELHDCAGTTTISRDLTFSSAGLGDPATSDETISVPCGDYSCVTAQDLSHTLRRTDNDDFGVSGINYVTNFSCLGATDDALASGRLNDDPYIDILDFGVFVDQYGMNYGSPDLLCAAAPSDHADFNGDSIVDLADFTFIMINFLRFDELDCCSSLATASDSVRRARRPVHRISVNGLRARGLDRLVVADLNDDGWVDQYDMAAFVSGARP